MQAEKKLMRHTLLLGGATALSKIAVFFLMPLYTAYLTPADFGTVDIIVSTAVLLIPLVSLNAPEAVFRFGAGGAGERTVFSNGLIMALTGAVAFGMVLPLFRLSATMAPYRYLLFFYVLASMMRSFFAHYLRGQGKYGLFALQQFFCVTATTLLELLFLPVLRLGVSGYLAAVVLADGMTCLLLFLHAPPWRLFSWRALDRGLVTRMLRYALPLVPTAILWWVMSVSDRYVLLFYHGEALTGLYAAAGRIPAVLTLGVSIFMEAWHYAALCEQESRERLFDRVYGAMLPVLVTATGVVIVSARAVISHLYAAGYGEAARYVPILAVASLISGIVTFLGSVYTVRMRSGASFLTTLAGGLCNLVLNIWWIPAGGAMGAALATLVSYYLIFLLRALHARRLLAFDTRPHKVTLAALLLLFAAVFAARDMYVTASIISALALLPFFEEIPTAFGLIRQMLPFSLKKTQKSKEDIDKIR